MHALKLMYRVRREASRLWSITHQFANRQVGAFMRSGGIERPQACQPAALSSLLNIA